MLQVKQNAGRFSISRRKLLSSAAAGVMSAPAFSFGAWAQEKTKVQVRTSVKFKGEYAPLFVALDKGYYAAEGLDVTIGEGAGAAALIQAVGSKAENFGYGPSVSIMQAIEKDIPVKTVALYQTATPYALISFPDVPLRSPKDLEGRSVAFVQGVVFFDMFPAFAQKAGFDINKIKRVNLSSAVLNGQFLSRDVDVIAVFTSNELPIMKKQTGIKFNELRVADYGFDMLGTSFFTNPDYAKANPEIVKKMLRATARGYADATKDPKEAAQIMNKHLVPPLDEGVLIEQVTETMRSTNAPKDKPLGWNDPAIWDANLKLLLDAGGLNTRKDLSNYFANDYL